MKIYDSTVLNYDKDDNNYRSFELENIDSIFFKELSCSLLILLKWPLYENL